MSSDIIDKFIVRLNEYVELKNLSEFTVVYHGGEPLLYGVNRIIELTEKIKNSVRSSCSLDFSLQTNGTLLTQEIISALNESGIRISLSIDGPKHVNDLHRLTIINKSSFDATVTGLKLLNSQSTNVFAGVISVIDPTVEPKDIFEFFDLFNIPQIDFLLPDSTYVKPPPGRDKEPHIYINWLQKAFTLWYNKYSHIPVRWFDSILASRIGLPTTSDAMGFGDINFIVIDTNGTYTDHDVFKITNSTRATLKESVFSQSFQEVVRHPYLQEHSKLITFEGLSKECKACPAVTTCGGGSVMHRYHPTRGFDSPTVYCQEFYSLISHATKLMEKTLNKKSDVQIAPIVLPYGNNKFLDECVRWKTQTQQLAEKLSAEQIKNGNDSDVGTIMQNNFKKIETKQLCNLKNISIETEYVWMSTIKIQNNIFDLTFPFIEDVDVIDPTSSKIEQGIALLEKASAYISLFDTNVLKTISILISDIIFIESKNKNDINICSFSDDKAPDVIYISPFVRNKLITPEDLGDSIIHEFLHHVLYHTEIEGSLLINHIYPQFPAPWKNELRPSGGFLHGTYVFTFLTRYWTSLLRLNRKEISLEKIRSNVEMYSQYSMYGIRTLKHFGLLTERGSAFIEILEQEAHKNIKEFNALLD